MTQNGKWAGRNILSLFFRVFAMARGAPDDGDAGGVRERERAIVFFSCGRVW